MANNDKQDWAETWVLKVGKRAFDVGKRAELGFLVMATMAIFGLILVVLLLILRQMTELGVVIPFVVLSMAIASSVLFAIQHFERRYFYKIIRKQKGQIEQLEKELRDKNAD
jgi:ABC-type multidrug transport system fused ATPase/permease subunit